MENKDFCVFILTHGRPDNVKTFATLKKCGYTGKIYFIIDNEDKTIDKYIKNFGVENVKVFDKKYYADLIDECNNFDDRRTTTHARNASFDIAEELGISYFIQLDDDYTAFEWRYISNDGLKLKVHKITNLNKILDLYIDFFKNSGFYSIAMAQGGDFIGGVNNPYVLKRPLMRKCMNSFICSTDRRFMFSGGLNEDVNTYCNLGSIGVLFGTVPMISITQTMTQNNKGGMSDIYKLSGTYIKSFHSVMINPSSVKVSMMNTNNSRIHHSIKWINTVPVIIDEKYKL